MNYIDDEKLTKLFEKRRKNRDEIIIQLNLICTKLAQTYNLFRGTQKHSQADREDMASTALIACIKAIRIYDRSRGTAFDYFTEVARNGCNRAIYERRTFENRRDNYFEKHNGTTPASTVVVQSYISDDTIAELKNLTSVVEKVRKLFKNKSCNRQTLAAEIVKKRLHAMSGKRFTFNSAVLFLTKHGHLIDSSFDKQKPKPKSKSKPKPKARRKSKGKRFTKRVRQPEVPTIIIDI